MAAPRPAAVPLEVPLEVALEAIEVAFAVVEVAVAVVGVAVAVVLEPVARHQVCLQLATLSDEFGTCSPPKACCSALPARGSRRARLQRW